MRARYYCPVIKRFINADIVSGKISDAVTLNRFAFANGNPVSFVDPFGLSVPRGDYDVTEDDFWGYVLEKMKNPDGSYSLYYNQRHSKYGPFHQHVFYIDADKTSFDLEDGEITLGEITFNVSTGSWEWKHIDLSLLDLGEVNLGLGYKDGEFKANAIASVWAPDITFKNILGVDVTITAHVGSVGGKLNISNGKLEMGAAYVYGINISFNW